jgi:hypothetical protein
MIKKTFPLITAACTVVVLLQPFNKPVESWLHYGFQFEKKVGPVQVTWLRIPSGKAMAKEVVIAAEEATGTDMGSWQLTDTEIKCAIGASEGTRGKDCTPNPAWYGHTDPGNGAWNMGTFSYQHGAATPEEADAKWLPVLRKAENEMQAEAKERFGAYLSPKAIAAGLDGYTQSPHSSQMYVKSLPSANPSFEEVVEARTKALNWSRSVKPGGRMNVRADQTRRLRRVWEQVHR